MAAQDHGRVSLSRRALAAASLICGVALIAAVIVLVVVHGNYMLLAAFGLALGAGGGWWFLSKTGLRRSIGVVLFVAGFALTVTAVVRAFSESDDLALRFGLLCALAVLTLGLARLALRHNLEGAEARSTAGPPRHPVLICNPWSGGGKVEKFDLVRRANELGVETLLLDHGVDLEQLARDAVARGARLFGYGRWRRLSSPRCVGRGGLRCALCLCIGGNEESLRP